MENYTEESVVAELNDIREKADKQLDYELGEIVSLVRNGMPNTLSLTKEQALRLVHAALRLRRLPEGMRVVDLKELLFAVNGYGGRYDVFLDIINADNYSTVSGALIKLIDSLIYDILDDGYIHVVRAVFLQTIPIGDNRESRYVQYHLNCHEYLERKEAEERILNSGIHVFKVEVESMKDMWFGSIDKFCDFLEIIGDPGNYPDDDCYHEKLAAKLDELMEPDKFDNWE